MNAVLTVAAFMVFSYAVAANVKKTQRANSSFDNVMSSFVKWGPDWRIEWTFHMVNLLGPDDPKRPEEQKPWEGYENKCHPSPSHQSSICPAGWYNLWHFSKLGSPNPNRDREPAVFLHWDGVEWLMRVDLTEPHLDNTIDHNSWDIPNFGTKPVGTKYNITFEQVMDEIKPGPNATTSKFKIWLDGVDQKVDMPSRYVPRADMQMYWSDPWHKPAGDAVVKTDQLRAWPTQVPTCAERDTLYIGEQLTEENFQDNADRCALACQDMAECMFWSFVGARTQSQDAPGYERFQCMFMKEKSGGSRKINGIYSGSRDCP